MKVCLLSVSWILHFPELLRNKENMLFKKRFEIIIKTKVFPPSLYIIGIYSKTHKIV